jgi:hypothetical protein
MLGPSVKSFFNHWVQDFRCHSHIACPGILSPWASCILIASSYSIANDPLVYPK